MTSHHDPAPDASDVPVDSNVIVRVLDDESGVDVSTIQMTVDGVVVTPVVVGSAADYTLTYDPIDNFDYGVLVEVAIDASDLRGNVMPTDSYSFTTRDWSLILDSPSTGTTLYISIEDSAFRMTATDGYDTGVVQTDSMDTSRPGVVYIRHSDSAISMTCYVMVDRDLYKGQLYDRSTSTYYSILSA